MHGNHEHREDWLPNAEEVLSHATVLKWEEATLDVPQKEGDGGEGSEPIQVRESCHALFRMIGHHPYILYVLHGRNYAPHR